MLLPRDEIEGLTSCDLRLLKTKLSKFFGSRLQMEMPFYSAGL
jgi:hypothetical protein